MTKRSELRRLRQQQQADGQRPHLGTRIDSAHVMQTESARAPQEDAPQDESSPPGGALVPISDDVTAARQWLARQARQISAHLKRRQADLDRRESQLHRQLAELENERRTGRLWFAERQEEHNQRDEALAARERELTEQQTRLSAAEQYAEAAQQQTQQDQQAREQKLVALHGKLEAWAAQLFEREQAARAAHEEIDVARGRSEDQIRCTRQQEEQRRAASLELVRQTQHGIERRRQALTEIEQLHQEKLAAAETAAAQRRRELELLAAQVDDRRRAVEEAEALLAQGQADLERQRAKLLQRGGTAESVQPVAAPARPSEEDEQLVAKRRYLVRLEEELESRREALEQLREDLSRAHRESLEMRLAAEELWAQLSGAAPPALLTQAMGEVRRKLADHYRLAEAELEERRKELSTLEQRLADQADRVKRRQQELYGWVAKRQEELDEQSQNLVQRQTELTRQHLQIRRGAEEWQTERAGYQEEIRRLMSKLRQREAALV